MKKRNRVSCIGRCNIIDNLIERTIRLLHGQISKVSQPSSSRSFFPEVPFHAPVIARAAEYCTDSSFFHEVIQCMAVSEVTLYM